MRPIHRAVIWVFMMPRAPGEAAAPLSFHIGATRGPLTHIISTLGRAAHAPHRTDSRLRVVVHSRNRVHHEPGSDPVRLQAATEPAGLADRSLQSRRQLAETAARYASLA